MQVDIEKYMQVNKWDWRYVAYLDYKNEATNVPNTQCPFAQGDVVWRNPDGFYNESGGVGVVMGCICPDGDMRLDLCGMTPWEDCRLATVEEIRACPFFDKIQQALTLAVPKKYKRFFHYWNDFYIKYRLDEGYEIEFAKGGFCPNWSVHLTLREGDQLKGDSVVASNIKLKKDTLEIVTMINDFRSLSLTT